MQEKPKDQPSQDFVIEILSNKVAQVSYVILALSIDLTIGCWYGMLALQGFILFAIAYFYTMSPDSFYDFLAALHAAPKAEWIDVTSSMFELLTIVVFVFSAFATLIHMSNKYILKCKSLKLSKAMEEFGLSDPQASKD